MMNSEDTIEKNSNDSIFSYHTFSFPFIYKKAGCEDAYDEFCNSLKMKGKWVPLDCKKTFNADDIRRHCDMEGITTENYYQMIRYFTESARDSILGWEHNFSKTFIYQFDGKNLKNKAKYVIKKTFYGNVDINKLNIDKLDTDKLDIINLKKYELIINNIKLIVFNTGVAVLSFETENHNYNSLKQIKDINEYGRRIYPPYLANNDCAVCADSIEIIMCDKSIIKNELLKEKSINSIIDNNEKTEEGTDKYLNDLDNLNFIKELLSLDKFEIVPAIDDRMHVSCLIVGQEYVDAIKNFKSEFNCVTNFRSASSLRTINRFKKYINHEKNLYELLFIDLDDYCSCQSEKMRKELIEQSIYDRWIDYGTIHGITHHSYICITSATADYIVKTPFLILYTKLAQLALMQRATILYFDEQISALSKDFEKEKTALTRGKIKELAQIQEKHIAFLSQHNNIEVTCQEQGIEIYNFLQKHMYIKEESEKLQNEIELLTEAASVGRDLLLFKYGTIISIIGLLFGILSLVL